MSRYDTEIDEAYCVCRGLITVGISIYGPFESYKDAKDYASLYFQDETWTVTTLRKVIEHGHTTRD